MRGGTNVSKYSAEQLRWCRMYEAETGWPALMQDFESGNETFYEAARKSVGWFESWASDALLRITASELPGKPQIEARTYDDARHEAPNLHGQVYLSARLRGATHEGANALAEYAEVRITTPHSTPFPAQKESRNENESQAGPFCRHCAEVGASDLRRNPPRF